MVRFDAYIAYWRFRLKSRFKVSRFESTFRESHRLLKAWGRLRNLSVPQRCSSAQAQLILWCRRGRRRPFTCLILFQACVTGTQRSFCWNTHLACSSCYACQEEVGGRPQARPQDRRSSPKGKAPYASLASAIPSSEKRQVAATDRASSPSSPATGSLTRNQAR
jgi:hypothetical protein